MKLEEILTIVNAVSDSKLGSFSLEEGDMKLNLTTEHFKGNMIPMGYCADTGSRFLYGSREDFAQKIQQESEERQNVLHRVQEPALPEEGHKEEDKNVEQAGNIMTSPLVGIFYNAEAPNAQPYVQIGDTVKKGQVLGIIEAMKLMNEIESEYDGVVTDILADNESMVEFGQPLFVIT